MATLAKQISNNLFESFLPMYGNPRKHIPVWDENQKMFIINNYESTRGNYYFEGIRFCDQIVIKEKVGLYHTWTYIDSIEIYAFNGTHLELVQKCNYEKTFRNEDFVRRESERMICDYAKGCLKIQGINADDEQIKTKAKEIVDKSYKSFLQLDYSKQLTCILPQLKS